MRNKNLIWGLFFICAGGVLIASQMGYLVGISIWSLVITVLLIPVIISSITTLSWGGILFPLAFILIMYKGALGFPDLSTWAILLAAGFGTAGLGMIFGNKHRHIHFEDGNFMGGRSVEYENSGYSENTEYVNDENMSVGYEDGDYIEVKASFSGSTRYINSKSLKRAVLDASFGALQVYFDNTEIDPGGAEIIINASFGGVELYIPKHWNVVNNLNVSLAGVEEKFKRHGNDGPLVTISGNASIAGVEIIYV